MQGMQALIGCLGLPNLSIEQIAAAANQYASQLGKDLND
jgi:hypothetical protein